MNLESLTRKLIEHCLSLGFGYSQNELSQYLYEDSTDDPHQICEGIVHEICHMLLLCGKERLYSMWQQEDMDRALYKLSEEDQDENEIETTALTIMLGRELGSEQIENIARGNVKGNLSQLSRYKEIDELLDPYLVSSNRSNYNQLLDFVNNL